MAEDGPIAEILCRLVDADTRQPLKNSELFSQKSAESKISGENTTESKNESSKTLETLKDIKNLNIQGFGREQKKQAELMKFVSEGAMKIADGLKGMLTKSFEVMEMIYKKLVAASPLLQAIEQLFNLAWTLFFMPIGNKLGELLIPAVINLMDNVMKFWDEFGNGSLGEMVSAAVGYGIRALSGFFQDVGKELSEQSGWVGAIGRFLERLGRFIESSGESLLNTVLGLSIWIVENIGTIITLIGTFMTMHYALQIATMAVIAASAHPLIGGILGAAAVGVAAVGTGISGYIGSQFNMAEGGYVPATPGGQIRRLAEAGEGEYVIPESKMSQMGGNHYTVNLYSYSVEETKRIVEEVLSDQISMSRFKGGF